MRLIDIKDGNVTVELSPVDCATLLQLTGAACQQSSSYHLDSWQVWAAFFRACTIASYSQWHTCPDDTATIAEQLAEVGLR